MLHQLFASNSAFMEALREAPLERTEDLAVIDRWELGLTVEDSRGGAGPAPQVRRKTCSGRSTPRSLKRSTMRGRSPVGSAWPT
jgi:hypothetical protein